ncbi:ParB N-terminal domain-containing protein [Streptomyces sp. ASQP_92]|uniref:ParB/RepB/Spo0J family partition protein n=1 Tax=Streptomyces sp. ASQP_92 TaxID=2979116 RepID=UPI0021C0BC55|nr:ParB N-terminal domain-containing protein [Streptomyces sp. ASQP_92]MCT9093454.1 ParB N-terminal domain-containing protein [Streptomyces sp. ASQP_92]
MATATKPPTSAQHTEVTPDLCEMVVVHLDADRIVRDSCNARETDTAPDDTLIDSVKAVGIQDAISVRPLPGGTYGAFKGWRRAQAQQAANATAAEEQREVLQVPAYVRADLVGRDGWTRLLSLIENDHREGMAERDKVKSVELALVDMSEAEQTQAAKALRVRRGAVKHARRAQKLDDATLRRASAGGMDLEQTAQLAEVADVPGAERRLQSALGRDQETGEGGRGHWDQEMALLQAELADKQARATALAALKEAKIPLLPNRNHVPFGEKDLSRPLSELTTPLGNPLTEANHSGCPDHSARLDEAHQPVWHCADPAAHGHKVRPEARKPKNSLSPEEAARRSNSIASTRAWKAAREPRYAFLAKLCRAKTLPEAARAFALKHFVTRCSDPRDPEVLGLILGAKTDDPAPLNVPKARDTALVFANVAAAFEDDLRPDKAWTSLRPSAAAWLLLLETLRRQDNAYALSEVEAQAVAAHRHRTDTAGQAA